MVPPHPGPLTAIATIGADLRLTMVYGLIAAIPAVILTGPLYVRFIALRLAITPDESLMVPLAAADPTINLALLVVAFALSLLTGLSG